MGSPTDTRPLCRNCAHFRLNPSSCVRPRSSSTSLVTGEVISDLFVDAAQERTGNRALLTRRQKCGETGLFFKERRLSPPPTSPRGR